MRSVALAGLAIVCLATAASAQKTVPSPQIEQGGSLPLRDVMALAKPYPNLITQIRLQLVRANLKADKVTCAAKRFDATWTSLGGGRAGPYSCAIGKRVVIIETQATYRDKNGRKLQPTDPALPAKATRVTEAGLKWVWTGGQ